MTDPIPNPISPNRVFPAARQEAESANQPTPSAQTAHDAYHRNHLHFDLGRGPYCR